MNENNASDKQADGYNYSTPIDFRPNRIDDRLNLLDKKLDDARRDLSAEIKEVRTELSAEIKGVRTELSTEIKGLNQRIDGLYKWVIGSLVAGPTIAVLLSKLIK